MDSRSAAFLETMAALAAIAVLAYLVMRVGDRVRQAQPTAGHGRAQGEPSPWPQLLATALVVLFGAGLIWRFAADGLPGGRGDERAMVFFALMMALALGGVVVYLILAFARPGRPGPGAATAVVGPAPETYRPPSAGRLGGLALLAVLLLLLAWISLPASEQHALMREMLYPAALAVALVLLFDKASRAWNVKGGADSFSEWLFCDALVVLLVLGYLNLRQVAEPEAYAGFFFDLLGIALFFIVFWLIDRKVTRYRFLVGYLFLVLLPLMLLLWRLVEGVAAPADAGWWQTVWPVFFLAVIGTVLEIIVLIAARQPERPVLGAVKDGAFFLAYGILVLVAVRAAA